MSNFLSKYCRTLSLLLCLLPCAAQAELKLPALISDYMVLQQHSRARLWGQAEPASTVIAQIANRESRAVTNAQGHWEIRLPHLPVGQHTLQIVERVRSGESSRVEIKDVAVGEVWLAAGQSNMEWPLGKSSGAEQVADLLQGTDLRFFVVSHQTAFTPQADVNGYWIKVTAENALALSGVAFHFARQLQLKKNVPVGVIQSAWGSTKAEAWTSLAALEAEPVLQPLLNEMHRQLNLPEAEQAICDQQQLDWEAKNYLPDSGITAEARTYSTEEFDDSDWLMTELPALFSDLKFYGDGAVWFRRTFTLPDDWPPQDSLLELGMVDDFDQVFLNGQMIGETDRRTAHHWLQPRRYAVDAALLKPCNNTLAIRIFDQYGDGGFSGRAQDMFLKTGRLRVPLSGTWKYKISINKPAMQADWVSIPTPLYGLKNRNTPAVLYNAMIAPLAHYTLQGVIWYQGESDAKQPAQYRGIFPALIRQWRQAWQQDLPFLFVQLANFNLPEDNSQQLWAKIRAIQADTAKSVAGTGMVTATDVGEAESVHPKNKQVVGQRLANLALATVYGEDVEWQNPECGHAELAGEQGAVILRCEFADGLTVKGEIGGFEIADAAGQFYPAQVVIEKLGDGVRLRISAESVSSPAVVRYAWRNNPLVNIYNADDLPLLPFQLIVGSK